MKKKQYHKERCTSTVRATIQFGNQTIVLTGTHSFEWSVVVESPNKVVITTFKKRKSAINEFNKYK